MATSEIEKLERRYAENPHGLTFAPLAEVHRKNGDVARALELLTAGLELHPNYIPASIVLGRCHQDLGDLPAAEAAFAHVLRLDDENVIALKSLADINERLERFEDAESWLRRLVSVDRSNEEAREQLLRLETARDGRPAAAQPAKTADTASSGEVVSPDLPPMDMAVLDIVEPPPNPAAPPESPAPPNAPAEPAPLVLERPPQFSEQRAPDVPSITDEPEPSLADSVAPIPGLVSQEFEAPQEPVGASPESLGIDIETSEEVVLEGSGASEYRVPNAAEEFREAPSARHSGPSEFRVPDASEEFREAAEARAEAEAKPAPTVPERPVEARSTFPAAASNPVSYSTRDTHGQSVAAFFRGMLAARPPADPGSPAVTAAAGEGAPSRPAQDGLSLSSVLGQEAPDKADAGVSFDDFFGSKAKGSGAEKGTDPGNDDLDQFHSWLQNLKR